MRSQLLILFRIPYIWWIAFLFKLLFSCLSFNNLTRICLGVNVFRFILFGVCWTSWMCSFNTVYQIWDVFNSYLFKYAFCPFLSLSLSLGFPWWCPTSWRFCSFTFILLWLFFKPDALNWSVFKYIDSSSTSHLLLSPLQMFLLTADFCPHWLRTAPGVW